MDIQTAFSCGDKAWVFRDKAVQFTVGQVRVEVTDTPGVEQDGIVFDNYAAKRSRKETYMCVETGIGSGSVYTLGENIFPTEDECVAANAARIAKREAAEAASKQHARSRMLAEEASLRARLAAIDAIKAEATP